MEYLKNTSTVRERRRVNDARRARVPLTDAQLRYEDNPSQVQTLDRLTLQATAGYFVFPKNVFDYHDLPNHSYPFGYKRGPFWDLTAEKDLGEVSRRLLHEQPPIFTIFGNTELFSPVVGVRFGLKGATKYAASISDIISSQIAYEHLRKTGEIIDKQDRKVRVGYAHDIKISIQQIQSGASGFINVQVEGIPSREDLESGRNKPRKYSPQFSLETISEGETPRGFFVAHSGLREWRVANTVPYKVWPALNPQGLHPIVSESPEISPGASMKREALYFADLLALRLVEGIARKQYGLRINQPLPSFSVAAREFARELGDNALVRSGLRMRKPNTGELEQILFALHRLWQPQRVFSATSGT